MSEVFRNLYFKYRLHVGPTFNYSVLLRYFRLKGEHQNIIPVASVDIKISCKNARTAEIFSNACIFCMKFYKTVKQ